MHDVSKSGETAFIEPLGILHQSNELENIIAEEKAEEIRILRNLSTQIRERADEITEDYESIVRFDLLHCIARFSELMHMQVPLVREAGKIHLVQGRHPLLSQALLKTGQGQKGGAAGCNIGRRKHCNGHYRFQRRREDHFAKDYRAAFSDGPVRYAGPCGFFINFPAREKNAH